MRREETRLDIKLAPQVGLEPTTLRLTAECSAIELLRSDGAALSLIKVAEGGGGVKKKRGGARTQIGRRDFRSGYNRSHQWQCPFLRKCGTQQQGGSQKDGGLAKSVYETRPGACARVPRNRRKRRTSGVARRRCGRLD
jgi:hypothetical protein